MDRAFISAIDKYMNNDLEQAIQSFRAGGAKYGRAERYYAGEQDLSFATEKFQTAFGALFREFAMNLCPAIVDAVKDELRITRFGISQRRTAECGIFGPSHHSVTEAVPPLLGQEGSLRRMIDGIWRGNRIGVRAGEIHKEALRCGDAYAIVWPDGRERCYTPAPLGSVRHGA